MYVSTKEIVGTVAMWAVRQSPYIIPGNFVVALQRLERSIREDAGELQMIDFESWSLFKAYLVSKLRAVPEYVAWNDRKNGNRAPLQFTSRYDGPGDPDNDFIDLDALEINVANSIWRDDAGLAIIDAA